MTRDTLPYLIPYFISLGISTLVALLIWRRREVRGAQTYAVLAIGQASWTLGYIFELASPTLAGKVFWDQFQWIGGVMWGALFPIFALQFSRPGLKNIRRTATFFSIIPGLFFLLVLTNPLHRLVIGDALLEPGAPFDILTYKITPAVWAYSLYGYAAMIWAFGILLGRYIRPHRLYRLQVGAIVLGTGIPLVGTFLSLAGYSMSAQRDITPLTFAIGNLIVMYGLQSYRLFDIVPIARDIVIENMVDGVIVVDDQNRIVDINPAAKEAAYPKMNRYIGLPVHTIFPNWAESLAQLGDAPDGRFELFSDVFDIPQYLQVTITTIYDHDDQIKGRVLVARSITKQKQLEEDLRHLNENLEGVVQQRTEELAQSYNTTLEGWAKALELRDKEIEGHSRRVTGLAIDLAKALDLDEEDIAHIYRGALLHDIGKMGIPDEILNKPGPLTKEERKVVNTHPQIAEDLLEDIPYLEKALEIPRFHHEKWDGTGYPKGLKGESIPLSARIFAVVDVWDALSSERPYSSAWPRQEVIDYLKQESESHFDPHIVEVFLKLMEEE